MRRRQWRELLKRLDRIENTLLAVHDHMNDCAKFGVNHRASNDKGASELMQEGIDNIMGYQWPPKKGGKE